MRGKTLLDVMRKGRWNFYWKYEAKRPLPVTLHSGCLSFLSLGVIPKEVVKLVLRRTKPWQCQRLSFALSVVLSLKRFLEKSILYTIPFSLFHADPVLRITPDKPFITIT